MPADAEMVTVFRSADDDAEDDARAIQELLSTEGIDAVLLDDDAPGVPEGAWEVRVPPADSDRSEELIAEAKLPDEDMSDVDPSSNFDAVTVFRSRSGTGSEMEAMSVKALLESAGINAIMVGDSVLPNLSFGVEVARECAEQAGRVIAAAEAAGADAADDGEQETETPLNP